MKPSRRLGPGSVVAVAIAALAFAPLTVAQTQQKPAPVPPDHAAKMAQGLALFKERVRPLLASQCLDCHGGKAKKGDFDLSDRKSLLESGMIDGGAKASRIYALVTHADEPHMPSKKPKLADSDIEALARWIDLGAPYDRPLVDHGATAKAAPKPALPVEEARNYWAFRTLQPISPPPVSSRNATWVRTPIDRFILAKLESKGLAPNPPAARPTLIRRLSFDLVGLPPTPEEIDAFVADTRPDAYERLVDRLLDSPHFGERWARHWMDVARFAESHGYEQDYDRPFAFHYRDFLIKAKNRDMPFDQFIRWQLAGDELAPDDPQAMAATGFLGAARFRPSSPKQNSSQPATTSSTTWSPPPAPRCSGSRSAALAATTINMIQSFPPSIIGSLPCSPPRSAARSTWRSNQARSRRRSRSPARASRTPSTTPMNAAFPTSIPRPMSSRAAT